MRHLGPVRRNVARTIVKYLGLEISRSRPVATRRAALIQKHGIEIALDIGANIGQYALELRRSGYPGTIISFEPLSIAYRRLSEASRRDPRWECHRIALGERDGQGRLQIASNLASSSLLSMLDTHRRLAPEVSVIDSEVVQMRELDSLGLQLDANALMKLDVQGYEDRVLRGANSSLASVVLIECEVSITPLYESQCDLREMLNLLDELGYELIGLEPGPPDGAGSIVYLDAMFARRPSACYTARAANRCLASSLVI